MWQKVTDKGPCLCEELLSERRGWTLRSPALCSLVTWSSTVVPLDLDNGELAGDCIWGQDWGSLRPQCHSAPHRDQEPRWVPPWQWRQRGEMMGAKALPRGERLVPSGFCTADHRENGSLWCCFWGELRGNVTTAHSGVVGAGEKRRAPGPARRWDGRKQAGQGLVGSYLRRADSNKAWKGPGGPGSRPSRWIAPVGTENKTQFKALFVYSKRMQGTLNTGGIWALTLTFLGGQGYNLRLKQGLKANEVCDVASLVPKCMFLKEFTLTCTHTQRMLRGLYKIWGSPVGEQPRALGV